MRGETSQDRMNRLAVSITVNTQWSAPLTLANFSSQLQTPPVEGRSRPAYRSTSRTYRSAHRWTLARCTFRVICWSSTRVIPSGDTPIANSIRAIRMALGGRCLPVKPESVGEPGPALFVEAPVPLAVLAPLPGADPVLPVVG